MHARCVRRELSQVGLAPLVVEDNQSPIGRISKICGNLSTLAEPQTWTVPQSRPRCHPHAGVPVPALFDSQSPSGEKQKMDNGRGYFFARSSDVQTSYRERDFPLSQFARERRFRYVDPGRRALSWELCRY
jgi:hypothetical protein